MVHSSVATATQSIHRRTPSNESNEELMLNPQKTLEREQLLKRIRELDAEIAQHERNQREGEARLPIEEQLSLKLRRYIEANLSELAGKVRVEIHRKIFL